MTCVPSAFFRNFNAVFILDSFCVDFILIVKLIFLKIYFLSNIEIFCTQYSNIFPSMCLLELLLSFTFLLDFFFILRVLSEFQTKYFFSFRSIQSSKYQWKLYITLNQRKDLQKKYIKLFYKMKISRYIIFYKHQNFYIYFFNKTYFIQSQIM